MAAQVLTTDNPHRYRVLRGRTIKVTVCDADPEFTSKIARVQDEIIAKSQISIVADESVPQEIHQPALTAKAEGALIEEENGAALPTSADNVVETDGQRFGKPEPLKNDTQNSENSTSHLMPEVLPGASAEIKNTDSDNSPIYQNEVNLEVDDEREGKKSELIRTGDIENTEVANNLDLVTQPLQQTEIIDKSTQQILQENELDLVPDESRDNFSPDHGTGLSVFNRVDLKMYSEYEWKGTTPKAEQMRLGYLSIVEVTSQPSMRKIRGDNYCGLRATCFQILSQKLDALKSWKHDVSEIKHIPQKLMHSHRCHWLTQWSFAGRLKVSPKKRLDTLKQCLEMLCDELDIARNIQFDEARVEHFLNYFNSGNQDEVLLFEAMKLLMLHSAVLLHESMTKGEDVPVFAWLLFARDSSENPEKLMLNHLNTAGDGGGLEQVEMFLLGYALNVTIRVVRPSQVGHEDFVTHYPDDHLDDWDTCNLIAEDDRHYNIIVP